MAIYTESATPNLLPDFWLENFKWDVLTSSTTVVAIRNGDMSVTLINGSGFTFDGMGFPTGGVVTLLRHFNSTQSVQHATITGLSIDLDVLFSQFPSVGETVLLGADTINGVAAGSTFRGYDGDDVFNVGLNSFINAAGGNDTINNFVGPGSEDDWISYKFNPDGSLNTQAMIISLNANNQGTEFNMTGFALDKLTNGLIESDNFDHVNHVEGTAGDDVITGAQWDDVLFGDFIGSTILGLGGNDIINDAWEARGGPGNDRISIMANGISDIGNITIGGTGFGDAGDDTLLIRAYGNVLKPSETYLISFDGGTGTDTADSQTSGSSANFGAVYDLPIGTISISDGIGNTVLYTVTSIENVDAGNAADFIAGTSLANVLNGFGGNDTIQGNSGDDIIDGGEGDDSLDGGVGVDTATYLSASGAVTVDLTISGVQNTGGAGADSLSNFENLIGSNFGDTLTGNNGANFIDGGAGNDTINGLGGDDVLVGSFSQDVIDGGDGDDDINGNAGNDIIDGGAGTDLGRFDTFGGTVTVNLNITTAQNTGAAGTDTITNIENLIGGIGNDRFTGNTGVNELTGQGGSDRLFGLGGADTLSGGDGNDNLQGGNGDDNITGGIGLDTLLGGGGLDVLMGEAGNDQLRGGNGSDQLTGGAGRDVLIGGDFVSGGFPGDGAADTFIFNDVSESASGAANRDIIRDFEQTLDIIDLSAIDAITGGGDDAFTFIGSVAFSNTAGELRAFSTGVNTVVRADVDGDGAADFEIFINGSLAMIAGDFVL